MGHFSDGIFHVYDPIFNKRYLFEIIYFDYFCNYSPAAFTYFPDTSNSKNLMKANFVIWIKLYILQVNVFISILDKM